MHEAGAAIHHLVLETRDHISRELWLTLLLVLFLQWQPPETIATLKATNTSITACQSSLKPGHVMHFDNAEKRTNLVVEPKWPAVNFVYTSLKLSLFSKNICTMAEY